MLTLGCGERVALERELAALAAVRDWSRWQSTRLIYADLLDDLGDPYHLLARASWEPTPPDIFDRNGMTRWSFKLPDFAWDSADRRHKLIGLVNARHLLHFAPHTLRLQAISPSPFYAEKRALWTHDPNRAAWSFRDVGVCDDGFAALLKEDGEWR